VVGEHRRMNEMKTTIPKGTKFDYMDASQDELYYELSKLHNELEDWFLSVQECIYGTVKNKLNYTITADLEDIESFVKIVSRQSSRFHSVVTWGTGEE
jgi:hypothetical protein